MVRYPILSITARKVVAGAICLMLRETNGTPDCEDIVVSLRNVRPELGACDGSCAQILRVKSFEIVAICVPKVG